MTGGRADRQGSARSSGRFPGSPRLRFPRLRFPRLGLRDSAFVTPLSATPLSTTRPSRLGLRHSAFRDSAFHDSAFATPPSSLRFPRLCFPPPRTSHSAFRPPHFPASPFPRCRGCGTRSQRMRKIEHIMVSLGRNARMYAKNRTHCAWRGRRGGNGGRCMR